MPSRDFFTGAKYTAYTATETKNQRGTRMKLSELTPGEHAVVEDIAETSLTRRLRDLGLTDGTRVACVMRSPLGEPCAYAFRGSVIAMRKRDADSVLVCHGKA